MINIINTRRYYDFGWSIKTNQPIRGAKNEESDLYQAILPLWSRNITIDGQSYPMDNAQNHGDDKTYLYVAKSAKFVVADDEYFMLTLVLKSQNQHMVICM